MFHGACGSSVSGCGDENPTDNTADPSIRWCGIRPRSFFHVLGGDTQPSWCGTVLASVLAAVDLGYRVVVVKDGLCSSSDEAHDSTLNLFMRRFDLQIELADAARVLETWRL